MTTGTKQQLKVNGKLAFTQFFDKPDEQGRFSAALIIEPEDKTLVPLKELFRKKAQEVGVTLGKGSSSLVKHGEDSKYDYAKGKYVLNFKTGFPFSCLNGQREEIDASMFKAGDEVAVLVSLYDWTYKARKGIGCNLIAAQLRKSVSKDEGFYQTPDFSSSFDIVDDEFGDDETDNTDDDFGF